MDMEDISARVLLKDFLSTEPTRTPVTRSRSQAPGTSGIRRSSRQSRKSADVQSPHDMLRRSLKHKIHESITRKSLPAASKRRTLSVVLRKMPSMLASEEETPRHLFRNILQTEPVKSPVVREKELCVGPEQQLADRAATKTHSSIELSGLDLPDVTIDNVASIAKGLSRKRPRRSLNITAFEKRLKDAGEETENSADDLSSLSSSSSLSLKTPFADVQTEKRGLQRKVSNRRKITEKEFYAAVSKQHMGDASSCGLAEKQHCEVTNSEGFTLDLSNLSQPNITADIVHCSTALYDQPDAMTSKLSTFATQDKPTAMLSQLQMDMRETEQEEEHGGREREKSVAAFPSEEAVTGPQNEEYVCDPEAQQVLTEPQTEQGHTQLDDAAAVEFESEEEEDAVDSKINVGYRTEAIEVEAQPEEEVQSEDAEESSQSEEEEDAQGFQTEEVAARDFSQEEVEARSEEEDAPDSQTEEESDADLQPEEKKGIAGMQDGVSQSEDVEASPQSEEEEDAQGSQTEEESDADLQPEEEKGIAGMQDGVSQSEDVEASPQSEEEKDAQGSQTEEEGAADSQTDGVVASSPSQDEDEAASQPMDDAEDVVESQTEEEYIEEEQLDADVELFNRRAHRSEGTFVLPAVEARDDWDDGVASGRSGAKSKINGTFDLNSSAQLGIGEVSRPQTREVDLAEPSVADVSGCESIASPAHTSAQDSAEQEEEWEDEDAEGAKTPEFVKVKRTFFLHSDPPASPSVFRKGQTSLTSEALPAAKPKQVRRRKSATTRKEAALPKTYLMSVFRHFAKTKVSADVYPVLNDITDKFFDRMVEDLETYAAHAKRKNIEVEDAILLLRRQGYVNDKVPVEVLIEKYLTMEQRKLLIPIATSGNVVIPKQRK